MTLFTLGSFIYLPRCVHTTSSFDYTRLNTKLLAGGECVNMVAETLRPVSAAVIAMLNMQPCLMVCSPAQLHSAVFYSFGSFICRLSLFCQTDVAKNNLTLLFLISL